MAHVIFVYGMKARAGSRPEVPHCVEKAGHSQTNRHYVTCDDDRVLPLPFQEKMIGRSPGAVVTTTPLSSRHIPQASAPDELVQAILKEL